MGYIVGFAVVVGVFKIMFSNRGRLSFGGLHFSWG